ILRRWINPLVKHNDFYPRKKEIIMTDQYPDLERILIPTDVIQARVKEMAMQINKDFANVDRLYMIGILKGAFIFMADLTRNLTIPHVVDFMALSSYGKTTTVGEVRILMDLREPIDGQHVMIVEDIVDSGQTLKYLHKILMDRNPTSLHTCVLVRKKRDNGVFPFDYVGFEIPDVWVVGYGLDYADRYRTLPFVAELKREVYSS
ncbi:MAG: hypoxanthine phosphoribosyltransferase, partial [Anaerolineaceae bacterium]